VVGITDHRLKLATDAFGRTVALFRFASFAVELLKLGVIDVMPERAFYRTQIGTVSIACQLHATV